MEATRGADDYFTRRIDSPFDMLAPNWLYKMRDNGKKFYEYVKSKKTFIVSLLIVACTVVFCVLCCSNLWTSL
jgi:hypothetical protein